MDRVGNDVQTGKKLLTCDNCVNVLFIYQLFSFSSLCCLHIPFHFCEDETSGKDVFHRSGETPADSTGTYCTGHFPLIKSTLLRFIYNIHDKFSIIYKGQNML